MNDQPDPNQPIAPQTQPLEYEETPIIEPVTESVVTQEDGAKSEPQGTPESVPSASHESTGEIPLGTQYVPPPKERPSIGKKIIYLLLLIILFGVGIGLSLFFRQYLPNVPSLIKLKQSPAPTPAPGNLTPTPGTSVNPYENWNSYPVISGVTRQSIPGITFMLPPNVASPICDGGNCASQGTYFPGGTRLTVAPRGAGQLLKDARDKIVSDLSGQAFNVKQTTVGGRPAIEFYGLFTGTTNGGYAFNQMHGYMVLATDTLTLEINHFTPSGVKADFASDDLLFDKIVKSIVFSIQKGGSEKGALIPLPSQDASPGGTATSPGTSSY